MERILFDNYNLDFFKNHTIKLEKKNIYVVLSSTGTLASKMIKLMTDSKYAHASISLDKKLNDMYSFARKKRHNPFNAGYVKEDITSGVFADMPKTEIAVFELSVYAEQYYNIESKLNEFWDKRDLLKYNIFALEMLIMSGRKMKRYDDVIDYYNNKLEKMNQSGYEYYFCSQFVTEILEENGIKLFDKPASVVVPNDYYDVLKSEAKLIYEGLANQYQKSYIKENIGIYNYNDYTSKKYTKGVIDYAGSKNSSNIL